MSPIACSLPLSRTGPSDRAEMPGGKTIRLIRSAEASTDSPVSRDRPAMRTGADLHGRAEGLDVLRFEVRQAIERREAGTNAHRGCGRALVVARDVHGAVRRPIGQQELSNGYGAQEDEEIGEGTHGTRHQEGRASKPRAWRVENEVADGPHAAADQRTAEGTAEQAAQPGGVGGRIVFVLAPIIAPNTIRLSILGRSRRIRSRAIIRGKTTAALASIEGGTRSPTRRAGSRARCPRARIGSRRTVC
jgi:hypothetical protein